LTRDFGGYELIEEIARGGMGVVWRARQRKLDRLVAIKLIREGLLAGSNEITRFHAEAAAVARLRHTGVVAIHEVGQVEGRHFYSMDLIEGSNLAQALRNGPLAPARASEIVRQIAEAVAHAHSRGVLHRDLKPANILLGADGIPHVTDFGLAKLLNSDSSQTLTGVVLGSPHYMSPEQAQGLPVSHQSDVYSLGAILYECLTGRPPFNAANPLDTMRLVIERTPPPARALNPTLPRDLETIASRCLAKTPTARYATAQALADDLDRFERREPILARPVGAIERAWRWSRRKPALASLAAVLFVAPLVVIGLQLRYQKHLRQERDRVIAASQRAERSEDFARENRYAAEINLAWEAFVPGDMAQARTLLNRHFPTDSRFEGRLLDAMMRRTQQLLWRSTNRFVAASIDSSGSAIAVLTHETVGAVRQANLEFHESIVPQTFASFVLPLVAVVLDLPRNRIVFSDQEALYVCDPSDSPPRRLANGHFDRLAVRQEDGSIASASKSGTNQLVRVFDRDLRKFVAEGVFPNISALAWNSATGDLWVATRDGEVWHWNMAGDPRSVRLPGVATAFGAAFAADFSRVARATHGFVTIHDVSTGKAVTKVMPQLSVRAQRLR
jgi:hypothetical protein